MAINDLLSIFTFWLILFIIGLSLLPGTVKIFAKFSDAGYIFSKILGMAVISYLIWLLGSLHILPFSKIGSWLIILPIACVNLLLVRKSGKKILHKIKNRWKIMVFEEVLFGTAFIFWTYIRAHEPSVHGLEKFMDFGFINSILRTDFFPPKDLWLTPETINYYYFGHLTTAVLTKLSGIPLEITFNLMVAALFGLTFVGSFSLGLNLFARRVKYAGDPNRAPAALARTSDGGEARQDPPRRNAVICGLLSAFLVTLSGNLHTLYAFTRG
ncbi:MAG: DUF2298 domain-containing protein, partial [bacterium]|nr:DUF2298 domain-containing protein [bacterium]